ncbi:MAG: glycoside hydrolase family 36 protein [Myxococcota bacterium]
MSNKTPLRPARVEVSGQVDHAVAYDGPGTHRLGPLVLDITGEPPGRLAWRVRNEGDQPIAIRALSVVFRLEPAEAPIRMFRQGYQSWSGSGVAVFGEDRDPSNLPGAFEFIQGFHHADQRTARPGELRSELVTVVRCGSAEPFLVGFEGSSRHDGTLRLRPADGSPELWAEAFLGDASLPAGAERPLHPVAISEGGDASTLLEQWADRVGEVEGARRDAPYQVGWCPWYHYFHDATETDIRANLAACRDWPMGTFQVDDAYQRAIGDWLTTNDRFPSGVASLAADIAGAGFAPGIWLAPFLAAPDSEVAQAHGDWLARSPQGDQPLPGMFEPKWSAAAGGLIHTLDTTHPDVLAHLERLARELRSQGWQYFKLDFTMAPSFDGVFHDPTRTPAERVRAGYDAFRRGAGDEAFILGCGAPIGHVIGAVDGNRIGSDVAPTWGLGADTPPLGPYASAAPATRHGLRDLITRSFMHRKLWLNDPDCILLRRTQTSLSDAQRRTWAHAVGLSGGMALVSDDMALLGKAERALFDEVLELGRASDEAARKGSPARCPDLLDRPVPAHLTSAAGYIEASYETGESAMERA